jgi:hypothetical protein
VSLACRKLEESQRLDPGGGTLLNLALCHEREGRSASAWVDYTEALGLAKREDRPQRAEFARAHLSQLEASLSRLTIEVPSGADLPDLEVKRDGSLVARAAWGSPVPVDPGDHVIEASAPGKVGWKQAIVIGPKADSKTVVIPALDDSASVAEHPVATATAAVALASASRAGEEQEAAAPARRTEEKPSSSSTFGAALSWVAMGVGVAGLGLGTYFGLHALALKNDADQSCARDVCTAQGAAANADAIRNGDLATASFGVGLAGVALGTVLFLARPFDHPAANASTAGVAVSRGDVSFAPGRGELLLTGTW